MFRLVCQLLIGFLLFSLSTGCQQEKTHETLQLGGQTMGTTWSVTLRPGSTEVDGVVLKQRLQQRLDQLNHLMSTYDPASELSRFNALASTDWYPVSEDTARVIAVSQEISALSGGVFDISIGPLVELWGFGAAQRKESIPTQQQISHSLARVGYKNIALRREPSAIRKQIPDLQIDLSAVAKGYAVDALAEILEQQGFSNYLLEIGGELRISGQRGNATPWRIAIEKPLEGVREVAAIFPLTNTGLATSGNYRNFYLENGQRYSHTIDPVSGKPVRHKLASVTVLAKTSARADALATALMVMGEEKGRQFCAENHVAAYFLIHEKTATSVYTSSAFELFLKEAKK